jgi:crossover junction endodeoxyribonuclease RuvC
MTILRVLGVDPGTRGAAAVYSRYSIVPFAPESIVDLPVYVEGEKTKVIDMSAFRRFIVHNKPHVAFIEKAWAMPRFHSEDGEEEERGMGAASSFNYGRAYGTLLGVIHGCGVPLYYVTPAAWKKGLGLLAIKDQKARKNRALELARESFPSAMPFLKRQLDEHRAEAMLIASYGTMQEGFETRTWQADSSG